MESCTRIPFIGECYEANDNEIAESISFRSIELITAQGIGFRTPGIYRFSD